MMPESIEQFYSEDYVELLIEYSGDFTVFERFPGASYQIINFLYAIVHVPVAQLNETTIFDYGYSVIPVCFGLLSAASLEASGIPRIRAIPGFDLRGQGVLIGLIDTGIDYTNPIFQYADGTTRIEMIWDQSIISDTPPLGMGYGTEYTREQINIALQSEDPLSVVPSMDEVGHGTMIAGIAGGNEEPGSNFFGVAPSAEFAIVKLKKAKQNLMDFWQIPMDANAYQSSDIFFAIQYLLDLKVRLRKPMVICFSVGSSMGSHDIRGKLNSFVSLASFRQGLVVTCAAGNEGNSRRHYFGAVDPFVGYNTVELNVAEGESGFCMELWGQSPSMFSVDILSPSGEYIPQIITVANEFRKITFVFEPTIIYLDFQMVESQTGDQLILFRFVNPTQGIWRFNIYERGGMSLGFNIWLPMESFISSGTYFIQSDPYTTISAIGNSLIPITVTAYNDRDDSLYLNSSRGFTRIGNIKPEIAAPGVNVIGPTLNQGFAEFTGTSVAAAHTTGAAALILEWGIINQNLPGISTVEVKKLMIRGAKRNPNVVYPNRDWGYGILDIYDVFNSLRAVIV